MSGNEAPVSQHRRRLQLATPLGNIPMVTTSFRGTEGISRLFRFEVTAAIAVSNWPVAFDKLLGQGVSVKVEFVEEKERWFNGIVSRITQLGRDQDFGNILLEVVPKLWFLTRKAQSRMFQNMSVPDIVKKILGEYGVEFALQVQGTFHPRDYCVQYRETDFNFVSRLLEEEGIRYFFAHENGAHTMKIVNAGQHPDVPVNKDLTVEALTTGEKIGAERILTFDKTQELRSGKFTLWDSCFELPDKNLEAQAIVLDTVQVGTVAHKLKVPVNEGLEIYDYPGEYAQRFDGVNATGGDQAAELQKIFDDNKRTTDIRMDQETAGAFVLRGTGTAAQLLPGHKFSVDSTVLPDLAGDYVALETRHSAVLTGFPDTDQEVFRYDNAFACFPAELRWRPPQLSPKPVVHGTQTAVVVGPDGQEIFTDKYGRVKVLFPWDREGKGDATSSCWIRVASIWAGAQWGSIHIPRVGHEVVVSFLEGDPDQPLIIGSVYNAANMPPYTLPDNMTRSTLKTRSSTKGTADHFNELRFEDKKDSEEIYFHAQKDFKRVVENDDDLKISGKQTIELKLDRTFKMTEGNETFTIDKGNRDVKITKGSDSLLVGGKRDVSIGGDDKLKVDGKRDTTIKGNDTTTITTGSYKLSVSAGTADFESAGAMSLKTSAAMELSANTSITLKVGGSSIKIEPASITISSPAVKIEAAGSLKLVSAMTEVIGSGTLGLKGAMVQIGPGGGGGGGGGGSVTVGGGGGGVPSPGVNVAALQAAAAAGAPRPKKHDRTGTTPEAIAEARARLTEITGDPNWPDDRNLARMMEYGATVDEAVAQFATYLSYFNGDINAQISHDHDRGQEPFMAWMQGRPMQLP